MYNTDLPTRAELPSTAKLLRSTVIAALVAIALLITTLLPAEYGIDPTGAGRMLGLTEMGEIKVSLEQEAHAEAASLSAMPATPAEPAPAAPIATPTVNASESAASASPAESKLPVREDVTTIKLKQGEATEIKLTMAKGAHVDYEWSSSGGKVNYDTHGDPHGAPRDFYHGYGKGRNKPSDAGVLEAAFDGKHGWFWRNRSGSEVTITLKTRGEYTEIKKVL
jgi:hypothetical protein